ncbi:MAG: IS21 family transposase, partial [Spirochaetales bacterium]|nr:IS21 family transposase [Candidatus Physcosoma equi]
YGGVSRLLICDNLKTGVQKHPKEGEIVLTKDYELLMEHYGTAVLPCGVKQPRQKNSTENSVHNVALSIIAKLRDTEFTSFAALKEAVAQKLEEMNSKPFEKRNGSRRSDFEENERQALRPLPSSPFELGKWSYGRKVQANCHVVFEKNWYSCPCKYQGETVDVKATPTEIQIFCKGRLIKRHVRFIPGTEYRYRTDKADMPKGTDFQEWDVNRILSWADDIGPNTKSVVKKILLSKPIPEQTFISALAVLHMVDSYGKEKIEVASEVALAKVDSPRYHHLKSILTQKPKELETGKEQDKPSALGLLKGQEYFERFGED